MRSERNRLDFGRDGKFEVQTPCLNFGRDRLNFGRDRGNAQSDEKRFE